MLAKIKKEKEHPDSDLLTILKKDKDSHWSKDEQSRLIEGLREHGRNWDKVTAHVATRKKKAVCQ